jgi:hypothetical protein
MKDSKALKSQDEEISQKVELRKKKERAGSVARVVEHLPSKCKTLSSNPPKKIKRVTPLDQSS